jgi:hypothetical protein
VAWVDTADQAKLPLSAVRAVSREQRLVVLVRHASCVPEPADSSQAREKWGRREAESGAEPPAPIAITRTAAVSLAEATTATLLPPHHRINRYEQDHTHA